VRAACWRCFTAVLTRPAALPVFDRLAPKLVAAGVEHRINVLRCSQAARSVGDVIVTNASRIKVRRLRPVFRFTSSCTLHMVAQSPPRAGENGRHGNGIQVGAGGGSLGLLLQPRRAPLPRSRRGRSQHAYRRAGYGVTEDRRRWLRSS
jgi:hypothetical protein